MSYYNNFIRSLVPGNYAITKSMEISKVTESGTLWYTKKFLILYYYIFLSDKLYHRGYKEEIIRYFDLYISSLPKELQQYANEYFYSTNDFFNFKSDKFKFFSSFIINEFNDAKDEQVYMSYAKKLYFTLLMDSGGQRGIKKRFKHEIQQDNYIYKPDKIYDILKQCAIEEIYETKQIKDKSLKSILSVEALNKINNLLGTGNVNKMSIRQIIDNNPYTASKYKQIVNDVVAFIRNERQILYYYGFFHSKSLGAHDIEFSSLTPLGEIALSCNFYEFLVLWEHQKIKMISQPPSISINNVESDDVFLEHFDISYTPYLDILRYLKKNGSFSIREYQYIISRNKENLESEVKEFIFSSAKHHINGIEYCIESFNRNRDIEDDDGRKELLKYILGIRNDIQNDKGLNPIGCIEYNSSHVNIVQEMNHKFKTLCLIYECLNTYKLTLNKSLFSQCSNVLKEKTYGQNFNHDEYNKVKIEWDLYNMSVDFFILFGCMIAVIILENNNTINDNFILNFKNQEKILAKLLGRFPNICAIYKLNKNRIKKIVEEFSNAIQTMKYDFFTMNSIGYNNNSMNSEIPNQISNYSDLLHKLEVQSATGSLLGIIGRERNNNLISLLKLLYLEKEKSKLIKCECCGEYGFIKNNGYSYIEFHHLIPFNIAFGPDHYLNLIALCPLCHRKLHYININEKSNCYKDICNNNYLNKNIIERLNLFKQKKILRSYHIEYLLADKAISYEDYKTLIL